MLFTKNISPHLSIDETALSNGELYTIVTNKGAKGRKGAIVAMIKGAVAEDIIGVLKRIPERLRKRIQEATMDMAGNMQLAIKKCFSNAHRGIDRFHVQKLAYDAGQECKIKYRWEALDAENEAIKQARKNKTTFRPEVLSNGDTLKQLLAGRSITCVGFYVYAAPSPMNRSKRFYLAALKMKDCLRYCLKVTPAPATRRRSLF